MFLKKIGNRIKPSRIFFLEKIARLFNGNSFFIQGRMDIDKGSLWYDEAFNNMAGGFYIPGDDVKRTIVSIPGCDHVRADMLILLMRSISERKIQGSVAEVGVFKGYTSRLIHHYMPERQLFLFDTFEGFGPEEIEKEKKETGLVVGREHFTGTSEALVLDYIKPVNGNVQIVKGLFPECAEGLVFPLGFAFVHLDADLYLPTKNGLEFFYPKMNRGGFIVIHDFNAWPGARKAVEEFSRSNKIVPIPFPDKSGSCLITKN